MIKGQAKIEFGTGDILVTPLVKEDLTRGCLVLQNKGTHIIGEYSDSSDFKEEETDTTLVFTNTQSLDVVIERLNKLKDIMNGNTEDCQRKIEYYY